MSPSEAPPVIVAEESTIPAVWPWQAEPYRLWSLLDMERYRADLVAMASELIGVMHGHMRIADRVPGVIHNTIVQFCAHAKIGYPAEFDGARVLAEAAIGDLRKQANEMLAVVDSAIRGTGLPMRWQAKLKRIMESVDRSDAKTMEVLFAELMADLGEELREPIFLVIPTSKREFYEQKTPPFGSLVADKFGASSRDVAAAARCFALDEWTACVSHLMRSLEHPLQLFAGRIGVSFPAPMDLENWKNIVDQMASKIEAEVKRLEATAKSHARNEELQFLGDVALDFRHFKNAWRNNVAHGREWYDEREAARVYDAVKHFMQRMAATL